MAKVGVWWDLWRGTRQKQVAEIASLSGIPSSSRNKIKLQQNKKKKTQHAQHDLPAAARSWTHEGQIYQLKSSTLEPLRMYSIHEVGHDPQKPQLPAYRVNGL